jgi:D-3-phosphoglycerate dehydrogenase
VIQGYDGIIVRSKLKIDKDFFAKATALRFVARAGSGKDNIDVQEAEKRGIVILNAPEGNRDAVAEHAVGLLLNLLNKINQANEEVKNGQWKREANRGVELGHQTVGIIGYGNTGQSFARCLSGFGCRILAYDVKDIPEPFPYVQSVDLERLQKEADVISLHIPLDARNRHFVDASFIHRLSKPVWLINTSRGEVVNTPDLIEGLRTGEILGAGLDVLENEKLATYTAEESERFRALADLSQVILSPHVAGWTHESYRKISEILGAKIQSFYLENE